jgi:hypothetical protein
LSEIEQRFSFGLLHGGSPSEFGSALQAPRAVHEKQKPFMAGEGDCPSAPSRTPVRGVHWSEAKILDGRSGRRGAVFAQEGQAKN